MRKPKRGKAVSSRTVVFFQCDRELADELLAVATRRGMTRAELLRETAARVVVEAGNGHARRIKWPWLAGARA